MELFEGEAAAGADDGREGARPTCVRATAGDEVTEEREDEEARPSVPAVAADGRGASSLLLTGTASRVGTLTALTLASCSSSLAGEDVLGASICVSWVIDESLESFESRLAVVCNAEPAAVAGTAEVGPSCRSPWLAASCCVNQRPKGETAPACPCAPWLVARIPAVRGAASTPTEATGKDGLLCPEMEQQGRQTFVTSLRGSLLRCANVTRGTTVEPVVDISLLAARPHGFLGLCCCRGQSFHLEPFQTTRQQRLTSALERRPAGLCDPEQPRLPPAQKLCICYFC